MCEYAFFVVRSSILWYTAYKEKSYFVEKSSDAPDCFTVETAPS